MTTRRKIDRYIHTLCEQQERADSLKAQGDTAGAWTATTCRNDAAQAIRFAFSAMRRRIEELEREMST